MSEPTTPPRWQVEHQVPRTKATQSGTITDGYDITFITRAGHTGTVFVPDTQYRDAAQVSALIDQAARNMDVIGSLTSED
jgi:hypothetical protein